MCFLSLKTIGLKIILVLRPSLFSPQGQWIKLDESNGNKKILKEEITFRFWEVHEDFYESDMLLKYVHGCLSVSFTGNLYVLQYPKGSSLR